MTAPTGSGSWDNRNRCPTQWQELAAEARVSAVLRQPKRARLVSYYRREPFPTGRCGFRFCDLEFSGVKRSKGQRARRLESRVVAVGHKFRIQLDRVAAHELHCCIVELSNEQIRRYSRHLILPEVGVN